MEIADSGPDGAARVADLRQSQASWEDGLEKCSFASEPVLCLMKGYEDRIAELQALYGLVEPADTSYWSCGGGPANAFVTSRFPTDPPALHLQRDRRSAVLIGDSLDGGIRFSRPGGWRAEIRRDSATLQAPGEGPQECALARGERDE